MKRLPLTVVSGYLGAGKTTLINRLLAEDHGQKLLVMVNDFGAINIDAGLLASADEDTIALTNGCVCCTMGADLFLALGDALDRRPRPDHLIVEASGVADPAQIANAALAEPDMEYAGIVTVVDGGEIRGLLADGLIGPQVTGQISGADLLYVTKAASPDITAQLAEISPAPIIDADSPPEISALLLAEGDRRLPSGTGGGHPPYQSWSYQGDARLDKAQIRQALEDRPPGVFRLKGHVACDEATGWEIQVVGRGVALTPTANPGRTRIVAIGLADRLSRAELDAWWHSATGG